MSIMILLSSGSASSNWNCTELSKELSWWEHRQARNRVKGQGSSSALSAHGTAVLQVLLQITPEHSGMSSGSVCHRAGTVTKAEELEQATQLSLFSWSMDLSISYHCKCSWPLLKVQHKRPKNPKNTKKSERNFLWKESPTFTKHPPFYKTSKTRGHRSCTVDYSGNIYWSISSIQWFYWWLQAAKMQTDASRKGWPRTNRLCNSNEKLIISADRRGREGSKLKVWASFGIGRRK